MKGIMKSIMKNGKNKQQTKKLRWSIIGLLFIIIVVAFLYKMIKTPLIEGHKEILRDHVVINPPENKRTYSSIWDSNRTGTVHARSMLGSRQAWSSQHNRRGEWMTINLDSVQKVYGIATQGRDTSSWSNQFVRNYVVSYSKDGTQFVRGEHLAGNYRDNQITEIGMFKKPIYAQYIRIYPTAWNMPYVNAGWCCFT